MSLPTAPSGRPGQCRVRARLTILAAAVALLSSGEAAAAGSACDPVLKWSRSRGGEAGLHDYAVAAATDVSGNLIVAGCDRTGASPGRTGVIVKFSPEGETIWTSRHPGVWPLAVAVDADGNSYVAAGEAGDETRWLVSKYDPAGLRMWSRRPADPNLAVGMPMGIAVDGRGEIVAAGFRRKISLPRDADWLVVKYNADGRVLWVRTRDHPFGGDDVANAVAIDSTGEILVAGSEHTAAGRMSGVLVKYNVAGEPLWTRALPAGKGRSSTNRAVGVDSKGNVLTAGEDFRPSGDPSTRLLVRRYSAAGKLLWSKSDDNPPASIESANSLAVEKNGGFLLAGLAWTPSANRGYSWLIRRYSASGRAMWTGNLSAPAALGDSAGSVAVGPDGTVFVAGYEDRSDVGTSTDWVVRSFRIPCR